MLAYSPSHLINKVFPMLLEPQLADAIFLVSTFSPNSVILPADIRMPSLTLPQDPFLL